MKKRVLALLLSLALTGALLPAAALAEEAETSVPTAARTAPERAEPVLIAEDGDAGPAQALDAVPDYAGAIEALRRGLVDHEEIIYLIDYNIPATDEASSALFSPLHNRYAELFHVKWGGGGLAYNSNTGFLSRFEPAYTMTAAEYAQATTFYNDTLDAIIAQVPETAGDVEKVLFVHDYLASHYMYDYSYTNYDAYSFLRDGTGVCQAYALTFSALMDKLDIPVTYVESASLNHVWNAVKLGGHWYHVDVTWDDPSVNGADVLGGARHSYFLLSDETNEVLRRASLEDPEVYVNDQVSGEDIVCDDASYETGAYAQADSPVVYVPGNDTWYYLSTDWSEAQDNRGLYRIDETGRGVKLAAYSEGYSGGIAALTEYQGSLFFADPGQIYRFELDTQERETLLTWEGEQRLSGFRLEDGVLSYQLVAKTEKEDGTVETVETMADFSGQLLPRHEAMDGAFSYYYNFGGVGLTRPADSEGRLLLAWYDPASGKMKRLAEARTDGVYGVAVDDKDLTCAAFLLAEGALVPLAQKFTLHTAN